MYNKPMPKNGVYFTRNLTESNYNSGTWLLGYYWRDSILSKAPYYPITNFDDMIQWYKDNYPTFIEYLGDQLSSISSDKLIAVMKDTAAKKQLNYPRPSDFSNSMMKLVGNGIDLIQVARDTASDVGREIASFTQYAFWGLVIIGAIAFGVAIYTRSGGKIKMPKVK